MNGLGWNIGFRNSALLDNHALEAVFPQVPYLSVVLHKILELCSNYAKYARNFKNMLAYSVEKNYALGLQIMLNFEKKHKICSTWQPCIIYSERKRANQGCRTLANARCQILSRKMPENARFTKFDQIVAMWYISTIWVLFKCTEELAQIRHIFHCLWSPR